MCAATCACIFASIPIVASTSSAPPSAPTAAMSISFPSSVVNTSPISSSAGVFPLRPGLRALDAVIVTFFTLDGGGAPAARSSSESSTAPMGEPFFEYNTSPRRGPRTVPGVQATAIPPTCPRGAPAPRGVHGTPATSEARRVFFAAGVSAKKQPPVAAAAVVVAPLVPSAPPP